MTNGAQPIVLLAMGGHAFMQNLRRGHSQLGIDARDCHMRIANAFTELAAAI